MRTHVVLPDEIIKEIDERVGRRNRSRYIAEVLAERIRRERLVETIRRGAGVLRDEDYPEWSTPEKVAEWVRRLRETPSIRGENL